MRTILLATALVALAPFAIAQTYPPGKHDPGTIARHDLLPQWLGAAGLCA